MTEPIIKKSKLNPFSLAQRQSTYPLFSILVGLVLIYIVLIIFQAPAPFREGIVLWIGGVGAFAFFANKSLQTESRLFLDLFNGFNSRFRELRSTLKVVLAEQRKDNDAVPDTSQRAALIDYLELSAEQWLFTRNGYIDPEAWNSWRERMQVFAAFSQIKLLWQEELSQGGYYGFSLDRLDEELSSNDVQ